jgi:hypothetical protein
MLFTHAQPTNNINAGITADPDIVLHFKTLSFYLLKEGLAMLILWIHGSIAYTLYAYTVQKASVCVCLRAQRSIHPTTIPSDADPNPQTKHKSDCINFTPQHNTASISHRNTTQHTALQISPARLVRNQRIWALVLLAVAYMVIHAVLSLTIRRNLIG